MSPETITTTTVATTETPLQKVARLMVSYSALASKIATMTEAAAAKIKPLKNELEGLFNELQQVAKESRIELFGASKTLAFEAGTLGYKLGDKKVVLPEGLNMKWFMQTVRESAPGAIDEKLNEKALVGALAVLPDLANVLKKRDIKIMQGESFYVTPKKLSKKQEIQPV